MNKFALYEEFLGQLADNKFGEVLPHAPTPPKRTVNKDRAKKLDAILDFNSDYVAFREEISSLAPVALYVETTLEKTAFVAKSKIAKQYSGARRLTVPQKTIADVADKLAADFGVKSARDIERLRNQLACNCEQGKKAYKKLQDENFVSWGRPTADVKRKLIAWAKIDGVMAFYGSGLKRGSAHLYSLEWDGAERLDDSVYFVFAPVTGTKVYFMCFYSLNGSKHPIMSISRYHAGGIYMFKPSLLGRLISFFKSSRFAKWQPNKKAVAC